MTNELPTPAGSAAAKTAAAKSAEAATAASITTAKAPTFTTAATKATAQGRAHQQPPKRACAATVTNNLSATAANIPEY